MESDVEEEEQDDDNNITTSPSPSPPRHLHHAVEYHESDFDWNQHANETRLQLEQLTETTKMNNKPVPIVEESDQTVWNRFYDKQSHKAFKPRSYLVAAFPELETTLMMSHTDPAPTLVDLGAGGGASLYPFIGKSTIQVMAFDLSIVAVQHLVDIGVPAQVADLTVPLSFPSCIADVALMIFTLSAISPHQHLTALMNAATVLKPGGRLLFRDYGMYDLIQVRMLNQGRMQHGKDNGVRICFFSVEDVERLFQLAGLVLESKPRYLTVRAINRKTGVEMKRVWIRAVGVKSQGSQ